MQQITTCPSLAVQEPMKVPAEGEPLQLGAQHQDLPLQPLPTTKTTPLSFGVRKHQSEHKLNNGQASGSHSIRCCDN